MANKDGKYAICQMSNSVSKMRWGPANKTHVPYLKLHCVQTLFCNIKLQTLGLILDKYIGYILTHACDRTDKVVQIKLLSYNYSGLQKVNKLENMLQN